MTTDGFELRGFSATLALEVLAEIGADLEVFMQGGARGSLRGGALGSEPLLFVPGSLTRLPSGEIHPVYGRLLEILELRAPHFERQELKLPETGWWRLDQVLPLLVLESGSDDEVATAEDGEWLLIDRRGEAEAAAKLVSDLRFHATHCRITTTTAPDGSPCLLIHVLADPERKPSVGGLVAAGALDGLDRLAAFHSTAVHSTERIVFFGGDRAPSLRGLDAFCRLLTALAPALESSQRLLAIVPRELASVRLEVYPLAGLDFLDQAAITPKPNLYAEIEILPLTSSEDEMRNLRERILRTRPTVGHHLELRPGFPTVGTDRELEHLVARQAELEQRRAYLESMRQPRPVLLRFTQHQLPALADAIRCFPSLEVHDGKIFYGFEATEGNPEGWHFLLFNPAEAVQSEPYPPWRWADLEDRVTDLEPRNLTPRFWLDPLWADDYHHTGECLVFVPHGRVLFPSLHSWRPEEMDTYLRQLLEEWFPDQRGVEQVPERALFLFDEIRPDETANPEIRIQVLDHDGFVPLTEQIGWINDNLTLQHALGGVRGMVSQMAEHETRSRLAREFEQGAAEAETSFAAAADATNARVAEGATELLEVMTQEIARIAERCQLANLEIPRMHSLLEETAAALASLKSSQGQVGDLVAATTRRVGENLHWVRDLDEELTRLDKERDQVETRVRRSVRELRELYEELIGQLRSVHR